MPKSNVKYSILLADDHDLVIDGYRSVIQRTDDFEIVGVANNGEEVMTFFESRSCDVVILDINMPSVNGVETIKYLKEHRPATKILVISMINSPLMVKKVIELGIDGYVFKTSSSKVMLKALRQIMRGSSYFEESIEEARKSRFVSTFSVDGEQIDISARELEIIKLVSLGKSTSEIADELFISPYTVQTHRKNINAKLGIHNTAALVSFAIRHSIIAAI